MANPDTLNMPVTGGLDPERFTLVQAYDPGPADPADWKLRIALESPDSIELQAVCSGYISTRPPDQILGAEFKSIGVGATPRPIVSRYYLQPDLRASQSWMADLTKAFLGEVVLWFVYENVDTSVLPSTISIGLANNLFLTNQLPVTPDQEMAFLLGQQSVYVNAGSVIGYASAANAQLLNVRLEFGVHTRIGYVDPVWFYLKLVDWVIGAPDADVDALVTLVGSAWPFLAANVSEIDLTRLFELTALKLYPNAVLQENLARLGVAPGSASWLQVSRAQKLFYLERLYDNYTGSISAFSYNTDEMINPFQLEAVSEFYLAWPTPGLAGTLPVIDDFSVLDQVNLSVGDAIQIVMIDPFDDLMLGAAELPGPDWRTLPYIQQGSQCQPGKGPVSPYPEDRYAGVLFLLYQGQVQSWYRWTSFSSHKWEDNQQGSCGLASSIQGNLKYRFRSKTSNTSFINFGVLIWYAGDDPDVLKDRKGTQSDYAIDNWLPGKYYAQSNLPVDTDGKTSVYLHFGLTLQDEATPQANANHYMYSGSGGCLVSPSFERFRVRLIDLHFKNPNRNLDYDAAMKEIQYCTMHSMSEGLYRSIGALIYGYKKKWNEDASQPDGYTLAGTFWLIRPDEPTLK